jgi:uncharacterized Zn-finger protein
MLITDWLLISASANTAAPSSPIWLPCDQKKKKKTYNNNKKTTQKNVRYSQRRKQCSTSLGRPFFDYCGTVRMSALDCPISSCLIFFALLQPSKKNVEQQRRRQRQHDNNNNAVVATAAAVVEDWPYPVYEPEPMEDIYPLHCETCGLGFKTKSGLKRHHNSKHLGLRPHKCDECDKTFTERPSAINTC